MNFLPSSDFDLEHALLLDLAQPMRGVDLMTYGISTQPNVLQSHALKIIYNFEKLSLFPDSHNMA